MKMKLGCRAHIYIGDLPTLTYNLITKCNYHQSLLMDLKLEKNQIIPSDYTLKASMDFP